MTGGDRTWLEAIVESLRKRLPIWYAVAALVGCAVLLRLVPFVAWWSLAYGELRLDLWWPLIFFGACAFLYLAGHRRHQRTGEPQFFPLSARFAHLMCLWLLVTMISFTASHWGLIWSLIGLAAIACASYQLALTLVAYGELWRTRYHNEVVATVSWALESGNLESILKEEARLKRWGSPHGLRLLQDQYQEKKRAALSSAPDRLNQAVVAGDSLLHYLEGPWAPSVLDAPARRWLRLDTTRELLTICLTVQVTHLDPHRLRLARWMDLMRQAENPYFQFLLLCCELGAHREVDHGRVRRALPYAKNLYAQAPGDLKVPEGVVVDFQATMQNTWLALAHHGIPAQAAFDLWMDIRREQGSEPFLIPQNTDAVEYDAALSAARKFLAAHYAEWAGSTAPGWGNGLAARRELNAME